MRFQSLYATALIYLALAVHVAYALPVPGRSQSVDLLSRNVADKAFADLSLRRIEPFLTEDVVSRGWMDRMPWKNKAAASSSGVLVQTEVVHHHDPAPKHRVQMPNHSGPRPQSQLHEQHHEIGTALTTDDPTHAHRKTILNPQEYKSLHSIPHAEHNHEHEHAQAQHDKAKLEREKFVHSRPLPVPPVRPLPSIPHGNHGR